jgi:hypothetical protein
LTKQEQMFRLSELFLLATGSSGLLCGLGDLATALRLVDALDDTDGDGLTHITDGETAQRRIVSESLNAHWLARSQFDDSGVTRLQRLWVVLDLLARTTVDLLLQFGELAGDVSSVAIQDWSVASGDLSRVVHDDDLSVERASFLGWVILGVRSDGSTTDVLDGDVLDVEANVVSWDGLWQRLVMHFNGLNFSADALWSEGDNHTRLQDTGLNTADWDCSNTTDLVDVLQWQAERLVSWTRWRSDGIQSLQQGLSAGVSFLALDGPSLEPRHVGRRLKHVVTVESRDRDESNSLWIVTNLLDEVGDFIHDLSVTGLREWRLSSVHLVASDNQLLDTQSLSQQSVLTGLSVLGDTGEQGGFINLEALVFKDCQRCTGRLKR